MWYVYYNSEDELVLYHETQECENGGIHNYKFLKDNKISTECVNYYNILNPVGLKDGDNFNDNQIELRWQFKTIRGTWVNYPNQEVEVIGGKYNRIVAKIIYD